MLKMSFFDPVIIDDCYKYFTFITAILSVIFSIIMGKDPLLCFLIVFLLFTITYLIIYLFNKRKKNIKLRINNTDFEIKFGDIFKEKGYKVIAFNEYFDTHIGDGIISDNTLNGKFIKNYDNTSKLDKKISDSLKNQKCNPIGYVKRSKAKNDKYELGTTACIDDEFLLTCLTHFDENNNAYIEFEEYISF